MRTEALLDFLKKTSEINRNFTQALFITEQFLLDNSPLIMGKPDELTRNIYVSNKYREKFSYKLKHIEDVADDFKGFLTTASFIFVYSAFELYIEQLKDLVETIQQTSCFQPKTPVLESLFLCLNSAIGKQISDEELNTLKYIRLRRNSIVHVAGWSENHLLDLTRTEGANLNSFWKMKGIELPKLDFSSPSIQRMDEYELIDLIRLNRHLASRIDAQILSLLPITNIIDYLLKEFRLRFPNDIKQRPRRKLELRFARIAKMRFNIEYKDINFSIITF